MYSRESQSQHQGPYFNHITMITFFIIGVIISLILNLIVCVVVLSKRKKINYFDLLMLSMGISDIAQATTGYPVEIHSFLTETEIGKTACTIAGFSTTFLALVSISHFVGLSIQRSLILRNPWKARRWVTQPKISLYIIIPSWVYGFAWSIPPLFGWSAYKREQNAKHRCSVDIETKENNAQSYAVCMLVFLFAIPVIIILITSTLNIVEMKRITQEGKALSVDDKKLRDRKRNEAKHTAMALVLILTFLTSWAPYATCVFVMALKGHINDTLLTFAAIFAKTSTLYNPIIYFIFMKDFRRRCLRLFRLIPESADGLTSTGYRTTSAAASTTEAKEESKM